ALCGTLDGSYECVIRVARSHQGEPYKLVIDNGEELQRTTQQGRASQTVIVEGEASASLELPVLGNLTTEWQGPVYDLAGVCPGPAIELLGSTLNFGKRITGTVTAHFDTQYDHVTIKINGNAEGEPQPARVLAFYAGLVAEQNIEPPEVSDEDDETRRLLCDQAGAGLDPTPDSVSCYELVDYITRCRCSGTATGEPRTEEHSVTCPDGLNCPGGVSECRKLVGSRSVTAGYTKCPDEEYKDNDVGDPEFYEETCCEPPPSDRLPLPPCRTITRVFSGGQGLSEEDRALYPGAVFVPVGPADGICGETVTTWQVVPLNCCDEIINMTWDEENCADIAPGLVKVFDGSGRYTWKLMGGTGFSFLPDGLIMLQKTTTVPWVYVYRTGDDCGSVGIVVDDGCTQLQRVMLSPTGYWKDISGTQQLDNFDLPADVVTCFQGRRFECLYVDDEEQDPLRPNYYLSTARSVTSGQFKLMGGGVNFQYWCYTCGFGEQQFIEMVSGISMPRFLVTDVEYGGRCAACSVGFPTLYEWVCE
ncbi:MAG: hypothetical protein M0P55_15495, partial [Clostridiales bacterium]|nr:hypothetical protein [Clostridiales bacterium]